MNLALVIVLVLFIMSAMGVGQSMARMHNGENRRLHLLLYVALTGLFGYWSYSMYKGNSESYTSENADTNAMACAAARAEAARAEAARAEAASTRTESELGADSRQASKVSSAPSSQYMQLSRIREYDSTDKPF